jgi:hypothetical protein
MPWLVRALFMLSAQLAQVIPSTFQSIFFTIDVANLPLFVAKILLQFRYYCNPAATNLTFLSFENEGRKGGMRH